MNISSLLKTNIMRKLILIIVLVLPLFTFGQKPKMHIRFFGGFNVSTLVYRVENVDPDILGGWQLGGGFRIYHRHLMGEIDFTFFEQALIFSPREDDDLPVENEITIRLRGFEVPITAGYMALNEPVFKCFLYGGLVNWFSLKGRIDYEGEEWTFKPKDAQLHFYNLGARVGAQFDLAMFNFDLNYTIGITNSFRDRSRTNKHQVMLNIGFLF